MFFFCPSQQSYRRSLTTRPIKRGQIGFYFCSPLILVDIGVCLEKKTLETQHKASYQAKATRRRWIPAVTPVVEFCTLKQPLSRRWPRVLVRLTIFAYMLCFAPPAIGSNNLSSDLIEVKIDFKENFLRPHVPQDKRDYSFPPF